METEPLESFDAGDTDDFAEDLHEHLGIEPPKIGRKHLLMYLLDSVGSVRRSQIEALARVIKEDRENKVVRPLDEVCATAWNWNGLHRDPLITRVVLSYDLTELTKAYSAAVVNRNDPPSLVDALAGDGPARPLIKDLYSLESLGSASVLPALPRRGHEECLPRREETFLPRREETFLPTARAHAHADALRAIFARIQWQTDDLLLVVSRAGVYVGRRTPPANNR